ncbi:hypothetical protein HYY72_04225 [Candidatus Woesearchaeota archaeon]|nr:hypothetical protein [Candidatus Woesearchaeota archaeon]
MNPGFVSYAAKKGLDVFSADAMKKESYKSCDVVVLIDVLHHVGFEREKEILKLSMNCAKKKIKISIKYNN